MPFTASHTAIVLPLLKRRGFSVSGLLMGSMVPDFEFFISLQANVVHGHSFWGMFWLNIPTALLCITIYHVIVRNQLILNLPLYFRKRFQTFTKFDWVLYLKTNFTKIIYSILIGNVSHLVWDAFTHDNGFVVDKIPFLNTVYWNIPLYHLLQYGFSVVGAIAILNFISKMPAKKPKGDFLKRKLVVYWLVVSVTALLLYILRYDIEDYANFEARVVFICSGFMAGLIVASSLFRIFEVKNIMNVSKKYQTKKL